MIPVTDQDFDTQWQARTEDEIALHDWYEFMSAPQADATMEKAARNLGMMVLAMCGGPELDEQVQVLDYEDWQEDVEYIRGGC